MNGKGKEKNATTEEKNETGEEKNHPEEEKNDEGEEKNDRGEEMNDVFVLKRGDLTEMGKFVVGQATNNSKGGVRVME